MQITQVGPLGVLGQTPLPPQVSSKAGNGTAGVKSVHVHNLTLTKQDPISKDIGGTAIVSRLTTADA